MNPSKQIILLRRFLTTKNYIILIMFLIVYYTYRLMLDIVFLLGFLLFIFILIKEKLKKQMLEGDD